MPEEVSTPEETLKIDYNPPKKENLCNYCGEKIYQRDDDKEDVIRKRGCGKKGC